jgi:phage gp45-like
MAVNDSEMTQKLQAQFLAGETITDIERFSEYGFESYPLPGAQVATVFNGGNRSKGMVLAVHDRRYRPDYGVEGDSIQYTAIDKTTNFRRWMKDNSLTISDQCINYELTATTKVELKSIKVDLGLLPIFTVVMANFLTLIYNLHTHPESGPGTTGVPNQLGVPNVHTTTHTKAS